MPRGIVMMGVTATGKSLMGAMLATALHGRFIDGDHLHPRRNVEKMARGEPLGDIDRAPWLDRIGGTLAARDGTTVIACSALKRRYRARIRAAAGPVIFVHLAGSRPLIAERMKRRKGHFMPLSLLDSQIRTLEPPTRDEDAIAADIARSPARLLGDILAQLRTRPPG